MLNGQLDRIASLVGLERLVKIGAGVDRRAVNVD